MHAVPVAGRRDTRVTARVIRLGVVDTQPVLEVRVATLLCRPAVGVDSADIGQVRSGRVRLQREVYQRRTVGKTGVCHLQMAR